MIKKHYLFFILLIVGACFYRCQEANTRKKVKDSITKNKSIALSGKLMINEKQNDLSEIRTLIRNVLKWGDVQANIDLLPTVIKDSLCVGFDLDKVHQAAAKLKQTGFFANEFIVNYKSIMVELDKKARNKTYMQWDGNEIPPFAFASDSNPWCSCQDNMPWEKVEVEPVTLDNEKGELKWGWKNLPPGTDPSWNEATTKFRVAKENGKWKIAYLDGFDYNENIKWPTK